MLHVSSDVLEFIRFLNQRRVDYLIVGGWALAFHAKPRYTKDVDILIRRSEENAQRMLQVLSDFGFGSVDISQSDLLKPSYIIQLGVEPNRIDLLTDIAGITFDEAWSAREEVDFQGLKLFILDRDNLIKNKLAVGRDQDLVDVKELRKRRREAK